MLSRLRKALRDCKSDEPLATDNLVLPRSRKAIRITSLPHLCDNSPKAFRRGEKSTLVRRERSEVNIFEPYFHSTAGVEL